MKSGVCKRIERVARFCECDGRGEEVCGAECNRGDTFLYTEEGGEGGCHSIVG
jgi:hypothetical protein